MSILLGHFEMIQNMQYGLFSKGASKMGYFFVIDKKDIFLCKLGNILILFNSKQAKKAGRALNLNMII